MAMCLSHFKLDFFKWNFMRIKEKSYDTDWLDLSERKPETLKEYLFPNMVKS